MVQEEKNEDECEVSPTELSSKPQTTLSGVIDLLGYGLFHVQLSLAAGLAFLADAMEMMILSVLAPALHCSDWNVTKSQLAFLTTMVFVSMAISSPIWGAISDSYGRRKSLITSSVLLMVFGMITAFSPTFKTLVALRFICGCFISCMPQCVTILVEYLPSGHRGTANIAMALIWAIGGSLTILLAWASIPAWEYGWRILIALCVLPIGVFLLFSFVIPESLLFLEKKGRTMEALQILQSVAKKNNKLELLEDINIRFRKTNEQKEETTQTNKFYHKVNEISQLLQRGRRINTFLVWLIGVLCGINYYGVVLFATELTMKGHEGQVDLNATANISGCHSLTPNDYISLLWTSLAEFPATFISLYVMDIIGRKSTFAINSGVFTLSLILIAFGSEFFGATGVTVLLFIARGTAVSYTWIYFVYVPEAYPTEIRSIAFGVGSTCLRIGGMITPYIAQVMMENSETLALGVHIIMGIVGTIAPLLLPTETKGIDLSSPESYRLLGDQ